MEDYEFRWSRRGPARSVRATSAIPGSFKHYDELASNSYENSASSTSRAARASSETRYLTEDSPMDSYYDSYEADRKNRLADIREITRENFGDSARDDADFMALGNYKITVTPRATNWTRPSRFWYNPHSSATTLALLDAYNPSKYPDFHFGQFGLNNSGGMSSRLVSSTSKYSNAARSVLDSAAALRGSSMAREGSSFNRASRLQDDLWDTNAVCASRGASRARDDLWDSGIASRAASRARDDLLGSAASRARDDLLYRGRASATPARDDYFGFDVSKPSSINRFSKFFHYYIPRHYTGTPMRGGYLMPSSDTHCTWKY